MIIKRVEFWKEATPLSRPYTIATRSVSAVDLVYLRLTTEEGLVGLGSASPAPGVTGETLEACLGGLAAGPRRWLLGWDIRRLGAGLHRIRETMASTPAARAAVDMALHDLFAHFVGLPLVEVLGRCHDTLPTSITIGIKSVDETLEEAKEYLGRGFRCFKVKTGLSMEEDVERVIKLRELVGPDLPIRVDGNQGYDHDQTVAFCEQSQPAQLELVEQPVPAADLGDLRSLPWSVRSLVAADESLLDNKDALALCQQPLACGIFNIKLMKCGGISAGRAIAALANTAGIDLMWGCNDESRISIAAALHVAFSCPRTRYLDLDGSLDLARDCGEGGFILDKGFMTLSEAPGLGVTLRPQ